MPARRGLVGAHACPDARTFVCSTLVVPLDHTGAVGGSLRLQVAATANVRAPRGVLLFLTGGPGQPGVPFAARIAQRLAPVLADYRLVLLDQHGTGAGALDCPALQQAMGSSDLTPPPPATIRACGASIGPKRRFFGTDDVVADLDLLRRRSASSAGRSTASPTEPLSPSATASSRTEMASAAHDTVGLPKREYHVSSRPPVVRMSAYEPSSSSNVFDW